MLNIYANGIQAITLPVYPIYQCITFSHYQGSGHQHSTVTFGSRLPDDSVKRSTCRNCPGPLTYFVDIFYASIGIYRVTITDSHICTCTYIYITHILHWKRVWQVPRGVSTASDPPDRPEPRIAWSEGGSRAWIAFHDLGNLHTAMENHQNHHFS
jgi:hypothetical protein